MGTVNEYRIQIIANKEKADMLQQQIAANDHYCISQSPRSPETHCMCKEFREMDHEGMCKCGLYYKSLGYD